MMDAIPEAFDEDPPYYPYVNIPSIVEKLETNGISRKSLEELAKSKSLSPIWTRTEEKFHTIGNNVIGLISAGMFVGIASIFTEGYTWKNVAIRAAIGLIAYMESLEMESEPTYENNYKFYELLKKKYPQHVKGDEHGNV